MTKYSAIKDEFINELDHFLISTTYLVTTAKFRNTVFATGGTMSSARTLQNFST